ncbi:retinol dehydrogenase 13 [Latimeria chalumnae]|uniref:NADP-retinol dehydrogenase n=1 Tax=Latimeria chalumnae TaxID=7897 RepID=H3AJ74_LATCH|nr:PREDICTED: retinol dehydrogenase 13 [Latimeria chalumnae]|eukprot:XP_006003247.1 PREDICTED: retinol dehydrogenase 13 [Latimeria chalumnae]
MNKYLLPVSVLGTLVGGAVLVKDYTGGGKCPSKATIKGKTVIITGANTGIGKETALELAKRGGRIIMACRNMEKCEAAAREVRTETLSHNVHARYLDLASMKSIREFARKINEEEERVDILINNAGIMRCPRWKTEDGFEMQFGVNHLGHFLLTNLLLDTMKTSGHSRIVNVSSLAHVAGEIDFEDINYEKKKYDTRAAYCQSKLAVVLFTKELAKQLQGTGVTANAVHPGVVHTELGRHTGMHKSSFSSTVLGPLFWLIVKTPRQGAQPSVYLAVAEELEGVSGKYFDGMKQKDPAPQALDEETARSLWDLGAKMVGLEKSTPSSQNQKLPSTERIQSHMPGQITSPVQQA